MLDGAGMCSPDAGEAVERASLLVGEADGLFDGHGGEGVVCA